MTTVVRSHQIVIHAPLQSVFDSVADLTRHPEWSGGELKIEALALGPVTVGKEYISRGEVTVQKNRLNTIRITEYESPYRFGFAVNDPAIKNISHVFTLTQQQDSVLLRRTMTMSLNPIAAFLFRFFIYPLIGGPSMDKSLAKLKQKLEQKP